jgi:hypothetical protein
VELDVMAERGAVGRLLRKYADRPMSLADAGLVRLAELNDTASILTIDGDFAVYRKPARDPAHHAMTARTHHPSMLRLDLLGVAQKPGRPPGGSRASRPRIRSR